jgi:hypothetical protein
MTKKESKKKRDVFEFAEKIKEKAKRTLIQDGTHAPIMFCMTPEKMAVIALEMRTEEEKIKCLATIKKFMQINNVWAYVTILKAWMVSGKSGPVDLSIRPSQAPDRINILIITAVTHKRRKMWAIPVNNIHGIITFGKEMVMDTKNTKQRVEGLFSELLGVIH